jgi:recombinational DNA repair protein RecR|tara:strand:+ start:87127 stop:87492 length:366 start_codon:yes stop_codon:yes gene_type:complete
MVVEKDIDCENIERSRAYNGLYFILGGTVPILEKRANGIREKELKSTVTERGEKKELKEVIIAFSLNPDGEHTGDHVVKLLSPLKEKYGFTTTLFGRGLSTGSELEYSDSETIKNAFTTRR